MEPFDWSCPFCNRNATITQESCRLSTTEMSIKNAQGDVALTSAFIVCPNPKCKKFQLYAHLRKAEWLGGNAGWKYGPVLHTWNLIPPSKAKSFPDYIPKAILEDYGEACLIATLSPKASATLSRRCIQGILRDFWGVKPGRLVDEIEEIKGNVDPLTWEAIEVVRKVGNIGAHMEKDINLIIDVEPEEADLLIGLVETLLKDWYVAREERKARLVQITQLGQSKGSSKAPTS